MVYCNPIYVFLLSKGCGTLVHRIVDGENITAILTDSQVIYNKEMAEKTVATFRCDGENETIEIYLHPDIFFESSRVRWSFYSQFSILKIKGIFWKRMFGNPCLICSTLGL